MMTMEDKIRLNEAAGHKFTLVCNKVLRQLLKDATHARRNHDAQNPPPKGEAGRQ